MLTNNPNFEYAKIKLVEGARDINTKADRWSITEGGVLVIEVRNERFVYAPGAWTSIHEWSR